MCVFSVLLGIKANIFHERQVSKLNTKNDSFYQNYMLVRGLTKHTGPRTPLMENV